ncbi:MAG: glutaredoxin domain-containing protein [Polyangiaceae bacterium]
MTDVQAEIQQTIESAPVVLFMKGTRGTPQCGFSAQVVSMLDSLLGDYVTVDVLSSPALRQGIKDFSSWPTIPQLYIRGNSSVAATSCAKCSKTESSSRSSVKSCPRLTPR